MSIPNRTASMKAEIILSGADIYILPDDAQCDTALKAWFATYGANTTIAITQDTTGLHGGYAQTTGGFAAVQLASS